MGSKLAVVLTVARQLKRVLTKIGIPASSSPRSCASTSPVIHSWLGT